MNFTPKTILFTLLIFCLLSEIHANYKIGRCPKLATPWNLTHPNEEVDHKRLLGFWQVHKMNEAKI